MALEPASRAAVIDLGTNTFNLLVFRPGGEIDHAFDTVYEEEVPVFLGKAGLEQGRITPEAFARGISALELLAEKARAHGAERISGFGCSTLRNATNARAFIDAATARGVAVRVLPGEEEADLILEGVRLAVPFGKKPMLVMDIGGGSIEFILATDKALMWKRSFELGVTRLRERIPISDPATMEEELRVAEHLDAQLEPLWQIVERHEPHVLVGSAGSFDSLAACVAHEQGVPTGDRSFAFSADDLHALKDRVMRMDRAERSKVHGVPPHRVDTLPYALIAIERVLIAGGIREMAWSRYALKEGAAFRMLQAKRH
jgi:exopolyphosphatase / guanosine-5'-triphosphate,3'-diphosphate pyrophosphatase